MKKRRQQTEESNTDADMQAEAGEHTSRHDDAPAEISAQEVHDVAHEYPAADPAPDELTLVKQERDKHYEQLQRALADLQNFRKRRAQDMAETRQLAVEGLAAELLPILDSFHLATRAAEPLGDGKTDAGTQGQIEGEAKGDNTKAVREGLLMVKAMLEAVLERHGLREVPAAGQAFDPNLHEAVGLAENSGLAAGQVARVVQKGYFLGDRVLRHAKVLVAGDARADQDT